MCVCVCVCVFVCVFFVARFIFNFSFGDLKCRVLHFSISNFNFRISSQYDNLFQSICLFFFFGNDLTSSL